MIKYKKQKQYGGNMKILMGIGNELNGDDAIGVLIARELKKRLKDWKIIDAGIMPENYISKIEKLNPDLLVMVDAIEDEGLSPGDVKIVEPSSIGKLILSTHSIPLSVLYGYLSQFIPKIIIIGIGIKEHIPYTPCTLPVAKIKDKVINILEKL